jgi:hypothetical protein
MMSYLTALTKDSYGQKKFKIQTDIDDLKFDQENEKKMERKKGLELDCIERAKSAAKEVRKRTLEASKAADNLDDDDDSKEYARIRRLMLTLRNKINKILCSSTEKSILLQ